jgi:hypothetical protein
MPLLSKVMADVQNEVSFAEDEIITQIEELDEGVYPLSSPRPRDRQDVYDRR